MSEHTLPNKGHYEHELDVKVQTCIGEYEEAMKQWFVQGGPTDPELSTAIYEQAKRFADRVVDTTKELVQSGQSEGSLVEREFGRFISGVERYLAELGGIVEQRGMSADAFLTAFRHLISEDRPEEGTVLPVAWQFLLVHSMRDAAERAVRAATLRLFLASLPFPTNPKDPNDPIRMFLRQVGESFVWGLYVPCIVFCRSALDVALEKAGYKKRGLERRIECAACAGLLDADGERYAMDIKKLGDDAVHGKPRTMADVLEVIRKTLLVLQQVTQAKPA